MGKVLITGPGRSGTTFLVQLLTRLGCDTGYEPFDEPYYPNLRAGCEWIVRIDFDHDPKDKIRQAIAGTPRILKSCEWGLVLKRLLADKLIEVDHVIIPIRDLEEAARSRLKVGLDWMVTQDLEGEDKIRDQANVKAMVLGRTIEACMLYSLPCTMLHFPLLVQSGSYLWRKFQELPFALEQSLFYEVYEGLRQGGYRKAA